MSDLIYLFLDGETDSTQQDLLFKSLADNPELQTEFQDAVTLNKSLSADSKNLVPSNDLTHNLFVKAGFESGAAGSAATGILSESGKSTFFSSFIGKIKSSFIPASIGSVITAALLTTGMYLLNIDFQSDRHAAVNQGGTQRQVVTSNESQIPVVKSEAVQDVDKTNQLSNVVIRKSVPLFVNNPLTIIQNDSSVEQPKEVVSTENVVVVAIPDINQSSMDKLNYNPELRYRNNNFTHLNTPNRVPFGDLSIHTKLGILVEVKGINNLGFFDDRKLDENKVFLNNAAMNIFCFKLSDNSYLGLSAGNEQCQVYEVVRDSNGLTSFNSEPNLFWIGGAYKQLFEGLEFLGNLQPYLETSLSYSKWGPVGKAIAGLYYNPENSFTMGFGLECTGIILLNTPGKTIATGKYALVYSFGYNF